MSSTHSSATDNTSTYIGRFAPSPSGALHFGSLIAALASYLDAKHHQGKWLVRMEDIDPPREQEGAKDLILQSLVAHGLEWDGSIMYQSQRLSAYSEALAEIEPHTYKCRCGRQRLLELRGVYDGHCLNHQEEINAENPSVMTSTRLNLDTLSDEQLSIAEHYVDIFQGEQRQSLHQEVGDFILRRKDSLIAYQMAVVVDDIEQGITHIIRGCDLLSSTPRQRYLTLLLNNIQSGKDFTLPSYGHTPIATNSLGQKLSKQHKAKALEDSQALDNLLHALIFLNQISHEDCQHHSHISELIPWAITHWDRSKIPNTLSFTVDDQGQLP